MRAARLRLASGLAVLCALGAAGGAVAVDIHPPPRVETGIYVTDLVSGSDPAGILKGNRIRGMRLENGCRWWTPTQVEFARMHTLGVNTVQITLCGYINSISDSSVERTPQTPTDLEVSALVNAAHANGFAVHIVPLWYRDIGGTSYFWRGHVRPLFPKKFMNSYAKLVNHWAELAEDLDVELFSLGSEAGNYMEGYSGKWRALAQSVDNRFSGLTTYQATSASAFTVSWWDAVDYISLSAYWALSAPMEQRASRTAPPWYELKYVWDHAYMPRMRALSRDEQRPIFISEVGYAALLGSTNSPAVGIRYQTRHPRSEAEQAAGYRALLSSVASKGKWMRGVVWFHWETVHAGAVENSYPIKDKRAECELAYAWSPTTITALNALRSVPYACNAVANAT